MSWHEIPWGFVNRGHKIKDSQQVTSNSCMLEEVHGAKKVWPTPMAGLSTKASCSSCIFCIRSATCRNVDLQSSMGSFLRSRETRRRKACLWESEEKASLVVRLSEGVGSEVSYFTEKYLKHRGVGCPWNPRIGLIIPPAIKPTFKFKVPAGSQVSTLPPYIPS